MTKYICGYKCIELDKISRLQCYITHDKQYFIKKFLSGRQSYNERKNMNTLGIYNKTSCIHKPVIPLKRVVYEDSHYHIYPYIKSTNMLGETFNNLDYRKMLECIRFLHSYQIGHLDIKPDNFIKDDTGNIFAIDLEFSKIIKQFYLKQDTRYGTMLYIAPEFINRSIISLKSDIYSLGKMYYMMKTSDHSFNYRFNSLLSKADIEFIRLTTQYCFEDRPDINQCIEFYDNEVLA